MNYVQNHQWWYLSLLHTEGNDWSDRLPRKSGASALNPISHGEVSSIALIPQVECLNIAWTHQLEHKAETEKSPPRETGPLCGLQQKEKGSVTNSCQCRNHLDGSSEVPVPALGLLMAFALWASLKEIQKHFWSTSGSRLLNRWEWDCPVTCPRLVQIDSLPRFSSAQANKWSTALPYRSAWPPLSSQGEQYVSHLGVLNHSIDTLADCIKALQ